MNITIESTKENVKNILETKLKLDSKILSKIIEEEIDGEALSLLRKSEFIILGIKLGDKKKYYPLLIQIYSNLIII